jgi:hypothetical protein
MGAVDRGGPDSRPDAGRDLGPDVNRDVRPDTGRDLGPEASRDLAPDRGGDGPDGGPVRREICGNGVDDDRNSFTDCQDPACFGDPGCFVPGREICNNRLDDDGDRLIDCADPDCMGNLACRPVMGREICDNGFDDNNDRLADCSDPQCVMFPACLTTVCRPDADFGVINPRDSSSGLAFDTRGGQAGFASCIAPGGRARVARFTVSGTADVRLEFAQEMGAAHVVSVFRAGVGQACDQNLVECLRIGQAPSFNHSFPALSPGIYWLVVQSAAGTEGASKITLSTARSVTPEVCHNGVDDDRNGLVDCQDLACLMDPACLTSQCIPDVSLGSLVVDGPPRSVTVDTRGMPDRLHPTCAGRSTAGDRTIAFSLPEAAGVHIAYSQGGGGDHVFALFQQPPPGLACDTSQLSCTYPGSPVGELATPQRPAGNYILVLKGVGPMQEGSLNLRISAFKNRRIEICGNGTDDDGNQLIDCEDPACFGVGNCTPSSCVPDTDLGELSWGQRKSVRVDVASGVNLYQTTCGHGNGKERVVRVTLTQPMALGIECTETGSHVLQLAQHVDPLDACDAHRMTCADPSVLPFGCNFAFPNLQAGRYNIIVEAFQSGGEGGVNLSVVGLQESIREICDNGVDDDNDGDVDCGDRKCVTSPICETFACRPDEILGLLRLDGTLRSVVLQTAMAGDQQSSASCMVAPGGQDAVVDFQLSATADVTLEWAQVGGHSFSLYSNDGVLLSCESGRLVGCIPTAGAPTGKVTLSRLNPGRYHLVVDASNPGNEGGVVLQLSGVLSPP